MKRIFFLAAVTSLLTGCSLFKVPEKQAPLTSRFKGTPLYEKHDADAPIALDLRADLDPAPASSEKTVFDFKGGAQKALVDYYAGKVKDPADLPGKLNFKISDDDEGSTNADYTSRNLTLTITVKSTDFFAGVSNKTPTFGDRLEKVNLKLKLDPPNIALKFKSWNKVNTQFARNYVGSTSYTGSQELNINPSIPLAGSSLSLGNYDLKNEYAETDTIAPQFVQSNGILHPYDFSIEQNGSAKTSVMGNTIVQVKVVSDHNDVTYVFKTENLLDDNGDYNTADKVNAAKQLILFPVMGKDQTELKGTLTCDYIYRHINTGLNTYSESDDEVTYMYGTASFPSTVLIRAEDLKPAQYFVEYDGQAVVLNDKKIPDPKKSFSNAVFKSLEEARGFMNWLIFISQKSGPGVIIHNRYEVKVLKSGTPNTLILLDNDPEVSKFKILLKKP